MNPPEPLDPGTRALVGLAAAIATGRDLLVRERVGRVLAARVPALWADELLLQSVLMVGYPRALAAALVWRELSGGGVESIEDGGDFAQFPTWRARGEANCRVIYGEHYDQLRANVERLHPALDAWMVVEGYGRTLGRPGLDLKRRELCVIAQVAVLGAERQLHSHLKGALHAGASRGEIGAAIAIAESDCPAPQAARARMLWTRVAG